MLLLKKTAYNKLIGKVISIDNGTFVLETKYDMILIKQNWKIKFLTLLVLLKDRLQY